MTSRKKQQKKRSMVPFYVAGGILVLLLVAFITTGLNSDETDNGSSNTQEYADVSVSGGSLPPLPQEGADPAVGMAMPEVTGESFDGTPVTISSDGRAKVILFLAHW
jgi:hypothetical protein